jgi:hypothetical protein
MYEHSGNTRRVSHRKTRAIIEEAIDRHYHALLDQSVPMLGDVSPRKPATTKAGHQKGIEDLRR